MGNTTVPSHEISANLRAAKQRLNMNRNKKCNDIEKKIDVIVENMKSGQENLALIQSESIINNERAIECYDVLAIMVEQVVERIRLMEKFPQAPPDMEQTFATLIYASSRSEITELAVAKQHLTRRYGEKYIHELMQNVSLVNDIVREKIDLIMPKIGDKAIRVEQILIGKGLPVNFTMNTANELRKRKDELKTPAQSNYGINTGNQLNYEGNFQQNNFQPNNFQPNNFQQNSFPQNNVIQPIPGMTTEMQLPLPRYGTMTESLKPQPQNLQPPTFNPPNFNSNPSNANPPNFNINPSNANPPNFNTQQQNGPSWFVPTLQIPGNASMLGPATNSNVPQSNPANPGFQAINYANPPNFQPQNSPPILNTNPSNQPKTGLDAIPMVKNSSYLSDSNSLSDLQNRMNNLKGL